MEYEVDYESNLTTLQNALETKTYQIDRSVCFVVKRPKIREIFAASFGDRIVHHLLVAQIEKHFEKRFIYDSCACRKNKGSHFAVERLKKHIRQSTKNGTLNCYYLQLDIKSFFPTIDKEILFDTIKRNIKQPNILWLAHLIIYNDPTQNYQMKGDKKLFDMVPPNKTLFKAPKSKGLPIGNLTSQFFANIYLNELDQFVKRQLKVKYYLRYVDDFVLLSRNKNELLKWREQIQDFLHQKLKLDLHLNKDRLGSVYQGVDFVGYVVKPGCVLSRKRVVNSLKTKLFYYNQGKIPLHKMQATVNSYYGHFKHANSYRLRKNIYEKHFGKLKEHLSPVGDYQYFTNVKPKSRNICGIVPKPTPLIFSGKKLSKKL